MCSLRSAAGGSRRLPTSSDYTPTGDDRGLSLSDLCRPEAANSPGMDAPGSLPLTHQRDPAQPKESRPTVPFPQAMAPWQPIPTTLQPSSSVSLTHCANKYVMRVRQVEHTVPLNFLNVMLYLLLLAQRHVVFVESVCGCPHSHAAQLVRPQSIALNRLGCKIPHRHIHCASRHCLQFLHWRVVCSFRQAHVVAASNHHQFRKWYANHSGSQAQTPLSHSKHRLQTL
mmetsp:Transcript_54909/g.163372  ORF Transcript_54909/g.163372 Transcript_54909/m.163372 type:complete len:227 (-) Transcript_54909:1108-1788(-)